MTRTQSLRHALGSRRLAWLGIPSLWLLLLACGAEAPTWTRVDEFEPPNRRDYATFATSAPDLLEPNYLPFMLHRFQGDDAEGDPLIFCRWSDAQMPIRTRVEASPVPDSLQDEFNPASAEQYALAADRALQTWETALEGLVRFQPVQPGEVADLVLRIVAEEAPSRARDVSVLGETEGILDACQPEGWDEDADRLEVRFRVPELRIYMADLHGPLTPHQVEGIALHELGHALGMKGHSPVSSDLMYPILQDGPAVERLSTQDVNSFVSLYRIANGARYGSVPESAEGSAAPVVTPRGGPPSGGPRLAVAPHVDATHGFELRPPAGWLRVADKHGFFTANGPTWDHDVSIEVFVWPSPTLEEFLGRFGARWLGGSRLVEETAEVLHGKKALRVEVEVETPDGERRRDFRFLELGDGRVLLFLADSPLSSARAWQPWLDAALESLEIWDDRSTRERAGQRSVKMGPRR